MLLIFCCWCYCGCGRGYGFVDGQSGAIDVAVVAAVVVFFASTGDASGSYAECCDALLTFPPQGCLTVLSFIGGTSRRHTESNCTCPARSHTIGATIDIVCRLNAAAIVPYHACDAPAVHSFPTTAIDDTTVLVDVDV